MRLPCVEGKANENNGAGVFIEGRTVTLSDFYMCNHEVTQGEWMEVMKSELNTDNVSDDPSYCKKTVQITLSRSVQCRRTAR